MAYSKRKKGSSRRRKAKCTTRQLMRMSKENPDAECTCVYHKYMTYLARNNRAKKPREGRQAKKILRHNAP